MSVLAAAAATSASGERRAPQGTEDLARIAYALLDHVGYDIGRAKVSRIIRRFQARVEANGWQFFDFMANALLLDADTRRSALLDPDVARAISYADPTGETAVNNVLRRRA